MRPDLSTPARIRAAAMTRFATDGLQAPLRLIASDAGVSAGLIVHHFGSREGLLEACRQVVIDLMTDEQSQSLAQADPQSLFAQLAMIDDYAPTVGFALRSLQQGGPFSRRLFEDLVLSTQDYLDRGVANGTISPSRDPRGRAELLCYQSIGLMVMSLHSDTGRISLAELQARLRRVANDVLLASLELYTEPLLTSPTLLDAFVQHLEETP